MDYIIRNEEEKDYRKTEELTRNAFWNVNVPGADEHYMVHTMRSNLDFIKELDFVIEKDGKLIANIMYSKAKLIDAHGNEKQICSFGPICVLPEYQRQGYGKVLIEHSFKKAVELGYDTVVIFGHPSNYAVRGFLSCKKFNICLGEENIFPTAMLVKELKKGSLDGRRYHYIESSTCNIDEEKAEEFDKTFPAMKKEILPDQEQFWIYSHSRIV